MAPSESRNVSIAKSPAETAMLGARLAARLRPGDVVCLYGPLGAGKTTFARGLIDAWTSAPQDAPSPTYTLVQTYGGPRGQLWHVDLYRLERPDDALELGLDEALENAVVVVEWPERLGPHLPRDRIDVLIEIRGDERAIELRGAGRLKGARLVD